MADISYMNPTALRPQFDWQPKNALAGLMWHQNNEDYRTQLEQQMRMQDMSEQESRLDLDHKVKDVPLRDLKRDYEMQSTQGKIPTAYDVANEAGQTQVAKSQYERKANYGDEAVTAHLRELKAKGEDADYQKFIREQQQVASMLERVQAIRKAQGDAAALGFVQQQRQIMAQSGLQLPQYFEDPNMWEPFYNASMNSIKQAQELQQLDKKGEYELEGRRISGRYAVEAASAAGDSRERVQANKGEEKTSVEQRLGQLETKLRTPGKDRQEQEGIAKQYIATLGERYDELNGNMLELASLAGQGSPVYRKYQQAKDAWMQSRMQTMGFREVNGNGQQQQPQQGGEQDQRREQLRKKYGLQ